jgi:amino acid transporter
MHCQNDLAAAIIGCLIIFVAIVSAATVAVGFSQFLHNIFLPEVSTVIIAIVLISILSVVNFYGISESIWINTIFTFIQAFVLTANRHLNIKKK